MLKAQQVLNPTNQYYQQTGVACTRLDTTRPYHWCGATVADILSNPVYLGHTLNMQSSTLSYKNKKVIHRPPKHMDEPGLFAGLVYCADCGGYMVLCRTGK